MGARRDPGRWRPGAADGRRTGLRVGILIVVAGAATAWLGLAAAGAMAASPAGATGAAPANLTVAGRVVNQYTGAAIPSVTLEVEDATGTVRTVVADAAGRFQFEIPPGFLYVTVDPPSGFDGATYQDAHASASISGLVLGLVPSGLVHRLSGPAVQDAPVLLGVVAGAAAGTALAVAVVRRERRAAGRSTRLLSRFGQYVVVRSALIPFQLLALLIVLYVVGSFLPALAAAHRTGCLAVGGPTCAPCDPRAFTCQASIFGAGLGQFLVSVLTGQWGLAQLGNLRLPAVDFVAWWLPDSIELAAVALVLSVAIGYPLGLAAGWRAEGVLDRSLRGLSVAMLLVPTFLVALFALTAVYASWTSTMSDSPYGLLPSPLWYLGHGGFPRWLGFGGQTVPTGFPIVDAAVHGDWPFVGLVGAKLLLQGAVIAVVYVSIFFRFARHAIAEAARSDAVLAARSRGVPEATLAWQHGGRRVLPVLVLIFGMTLPAYLGTQMVVEFLFNDTQGFGTILFAEMTQVGSQGFGIIHRGAAPVGNLYQVTILFLALLLLVGNLCADILARYLDHTLDSPEDR